MQSQLSWYVLLDNEPVAAFPTREMAYFFLYHIREGRLPHQNEGPGSWPPIDPGGHSRRYHLEERP